MLKSHPKALTQCEPPSLDWSRPGTPAATDFDDIYFSVDGGTEETRTVFLGGCGLPDGWAGKMLYTIGELGFGSGLNFLTTWQMWEQASPRICAKTARLHFISIEKHPFSAAQLEQALNAWPELSDYAAQLISAWPERVKGFHRLHFGRVTLTLIHDDIANALEALDAQVDAWFLDGFSPKKNPHMWSTNIMTKLASLSADGARLATFTVAGSVRQALSEAGFQTEKKTGFGRKRHRLEARFIPAHKPAKPQRSKPSLIPTIIGTGIGGASLARAFMRRGIKPRIVSRGNKHAASGNAAALVKPRFDLQDRPESRFYLASYLYALQAYGKTDAILSRGVTQFPKTENEFTRFAKLAAQAALPLNYFHLDNGILSLPQSLTVSPQKLIAVFTQELEITTETISHLDEIDGPIFAAMGYGINSIFNSGLPKLRFSRGQISWVKAANNIKMPMSYGGYVIPFDNKCLIGATHDAVRGDAPYAVRPEDDRRNFEAFSNIMRYDLTPDLSEPSRASIRVTTPDTLPMILTPKPNQYILTGLGSRGFVFAPLLAEAIVSHWLGEPLPIEKKVWARFGPR